MKHDTQHLEFLISQYVDGTLDVPTRKTIEQQLLVDPVARGLYKDQRDTQDLLDDLGSRLPLINWAEFDAKLAERLENEVPAEVSAGSLWRRWAKPLAIAASLAVAVGVGYIVAGVTGGGSLPTHNGGTAEQPLPTIQRFRIEEQPVARPSIGSVAVHAPEEISGGVATAGVVQDNGATAGIDEGARWMFGKQPGAVHAGTTLKPDSGELILQW